jgi:hypothetical protein
MSGESGCQRSHRSSKAHIPRPSSPSINNLPPHSAPSTPNLAYEPSSRRSKLLRSFVHLESPRRAYLRWKSTELSHPSSHRSRASLPRMISSLLGSGSGSDSTTSIDDSDSDTGNSVVLQASKSTASDRRVPQRFEAVFEANKGRNEHTSATSSTQEVQSSMATLDFPGRGIFTFSGPMPRTEPDSGNRTQQFLCQS